MRIKYLLGLLFWVALCGQTHAQAGDRARSWEAGFHIADMSSVSNINRFGASIDVDDQIGYGFTGGYNFTNRFAVLFDANWSRPDYTATVVPDGPGGPRSISTKLDLSTFQAKGVFYFLEGDLTPFVELGIGWTTIDSNIIDGPVITECWWDFFWGYVCRNFYETYSETEMSYSAGLGVRWDIDDSYMLRAGIGRLELDVDRIRADPSIDTLQVDFAWRF